MHRTWSSLILILVFALVRICTAEEEPAKTWQYSADVLQPFWETSVMRGESMLFLKSSADGQARASVCFPIENPLSVTNSSGSVTYEEGRDFQWTKGSRKIVLPKGSRIVSSTPADLRRPAKSQQYHLPHRDGNGDIFFGGRLEYADLQTCVTYEHAAESWHDIAPTFDESALPATIKKLRAKQPLRIVTIGDSISAGCNASGWAGAPPFQPAYPELVRLNLEKHSGSKVSLTNLSVSGMSTDWALTMVDKIVEARPDLVIVAFGMNDASGRPTAEYQANTKAVVDRVRHRLPEAEFILVATMIGNRDWVSLKQELFPEFRAALKELRGPGVAVADVTTIWGELLKRKTHYDLTGNGVNHPNDFGHRVYAQVISALLVPKTRVRE
jgi:acyl-CoA thioesterase I